MNAEFWLNLGIAGAVVAVVNLFLRHLRRERLSCDACRRAHDQTTQEFSRVVSNHLAHEREALDRLADAIRNLESLIGDFLKRA